MKKVYQKLKNDIIAWSNAYSKTQEEKHKAKQQLDNFTLQQEEKMKTKLKITNLPDKKSICFNCSLKNDWCNFRLLNPDRNFILVTCPNFKQEVKK